MKEEAKIRKIEKQAKKFISRARKGPEDRKRHDQVQQDEQKAMWNAHTELGWGFLKIGSLFNRDWRTVKKAVETYEPGKPQTLVSAEKVRALIGKCRVEVASYSVVNLLQWWLDKTNEGASIRYYTDEDVEMLYFEARDHHVEPLRAKPFLLQVENDPEFGLLRQTFPASDIWTVFPTWHEQTVPYTAALFLVLERVRNLLVREFGMPFSENREKGLGGVAWVYGIGVVGADKMCQLERIVMVLLTCDLLVSRIAELPSNSCWTHLINDLEILRLRMNRELSAVTDMAANGGWPSRVKEIRAGLADGPRELTQRFLDKLVEWQSTQDSLLEALKKLESRI